MPPGLPPTSGTRDLSRRTGRGPDAGLKFHAAGLGCVALRTEVRVPIVGIGHGGAAAIPECAPPLAPPGCIHALPPRRPHEVAKLLRQRRGKRSRAAYPLP